MSKKIKLIDIHRFWFTAIQLRAFWTLVYQQRVHIFNSTFNMLWRSTKPKILSSIPHFPAKLLNCLLTCTYKCWNLRMYRETDARTVDSSKTDKFLKATVCLVQRCTLVHYSTGCRNTWRNAPPWNCLSFYNVALNFHSVEIVIRI